MNEHDSDQRLRSWVRSPADRPTPPELRHRILDIPTTAPTIRPKGGTRTMFSATKLVGIAAAIALFGALMLAIPPGQQQTEPAPAAPASEPGEITSFSGELRILGQDRAASVERFDWGNDMPGEQWTVRYTMSDPRMSGVATAFQNVYEVGPDKTRLMRQEGRRFTKEGSWYETSHAYQDPVTTGIQIQTHSVGEGIYEGLYATSLCGQAAFSGNWDCHGIIFSGGWPEAPGEAPGEIPLIHGTP